ncbi:MAG: glycosyltransferase family 4 protein [Mariprofundaceae bacterium]|nr:glycosyltransferase family 4 protein [Mariprofundaceae bacterium]
MVIPMRVLLVADVSAEKVLGGAERMLVHHVRALIENGHSLTLLTRQPQPDAPSEMMLDEGVREYRLQFSGDKGPRGLRQLVAGARIWWRQHAGEFDVIVGEQPFVMWALLRAGCKLPRLQVCHSFAYQEYATRHGLDWNLRHRLVTAAMRRLEAGIYRSASRLLVLSVHMQREFAACFDIPAARVSVAPGGVIVPTLMCEGEREQYREELDWRGPVVVTLRNLVPRTGVDMLIQAAAILRLQMPTLRWCVMGSGALLESLRWLAEQLEVDDIIEFSGYLAEQEVVKRMQAADAFMLPTRSLEGFGLVTIEANACGLPVVATPVGGNIEVASSCELNHLADAITPQALAEALLDVLDENGVHAEKALHLRQHVAENFSWRQHDGLFLQAVESVH